MLDIKVTNINNRYHARLIKDGEVIDEMSCKERSSIGWICREMLRWACKLGNQDPWAHAARKRQSSSVKPADVKYIGVN